MAYVASSTRSTGYLVTAANWNEMVGNDAACAVASFTTKGDLFVASGSAAGARLAAGADFKVPFYKAAESLGIFSRIAPLVMFSSVAEVAVVNTTTETVLWEVASPGLPAGWLGTTGAVRMNFMYHWYNNSGSSRNFVYKLYYGANTVTWTDSNGASTTEYVQEWELFLRANAATNSQEVFGRGAQYNVSAGGGSQTVYGSTTIATDSTADAVLKLTVTLATASASLWVKKRYANVQFLAPS